MCECAKFTFATRYKIVMCWVENLYTSKTGILMLNLELISQLNKYEHVCVRVWVGFSIITHIESIISTLHSSSPSPSSSSSFHHHKFYLSPLIQYGIKIIQYHHFKFLMDPNSMITTSLYHHHCTLIVKSIPLEFSQNWFWCIVACAALGKPYTGLDSPFVNQMATHRHTQTITIIIH